MRKFIVCIWIIMLTALFLGSSGCATFETVSNARINSPKFFSGTRLDLNAINNNKVALKKFNVQPPEYPLLDLPGSFVLDIVVSPLTGGAALYETLVY